MKKFMFYLMVVNTFLASIVMIAVLAMGDTSLPALTLGLRGALIVAGVALVAKRCVSWVRRGEIVAFYVADAALALFNLVYLSMIFPVEVQPLEFFLTGTLVGPVLNAVLIFLLCKVSSRYAVIEENAEEDGTAVANLSGRAVKQN